MPTVRRTLARLSLPGRGAWLRTASLALLAASAAFAQVTIQTTSPLPNGSAGVAYTPLTFAATGGVTPYQWTFTGNMPPGMNLSTAGVLSGTPTADGNYSIAVTVTDSSSPPGQTSTSEFAILITPTITTTS